LDQAPATHRRTQGWPPIVWWLTTLAWAATIYAFSTGTYSGSLTGWLLQEVLEFFHILVSPATFRLVHHILRKLAHLSEYAIFCMLLYGSFSGGQDFSWRARKALASLVIAATYSLTDEFHQLFVPGRGASIVDCGIDAAGAALGMLLVYARARLAPVRASNTTAPDASPAQRQKGVAEE
jgi:VanZ family protein